MVSAHRNFPPDNSSLVVTQTQQDTEPQIVTIGGGGQRNLIANILSDPEFHSLVNSTEASVTSRVDNGRQ